MLLPYTQQRQGRRDDSLPSCSRKQKLLPSMQPKTTIAQYVLDQLDAHEGAAPVAKLAEVLSTATAADLVAVVEGIAQRPVDRAAVGPLVRMAQHVAARIRALRGSGEDRNLAEDQRLSDALVACYRATAQPAPEAAGHFLQALVEQGTRESIATVASLLLSLPPDDWKVVGIGLGPLWRADATILQEVFTPLVGSPLQPSVLAVLLDLANYCVRTQRLETHPWHQHAEALARMLSGLTAQLERMQANPAQFGESVEEVQQQLADALALVVGLCDALGLIGDQRAVGALEGAMELAHRRIQTEAAAALARMGVA
ncbi:MAG: hypothetical protein D6753_10080, partial [Planctomycetota bacterium]